MPPEVILTCAVSGGHNHHAKHPCYPITPEQIAHDCIEVGKAGAAIAHIHVREPSTGARSGEPALFREVVHRIRDSGSDILINLTTSEGARFVPGTVEANIGGPGTTLVPPLERLVHIAELRPDICTLDMGSFNFGDAIFVNTPTHLKIMATRIQALGVKPELEVFEAGHIRFARMFIELGLIDAPPMFQLCLGIPHAAPATTEMLTLMKNMLPPDANWSAFGIARTEFTILAQAASAGGNCRVGLEDNLYLDKGEFATNIRLVERAVTIIRAIGREPATVTQAAARLGITARSVV